MNINYNIFEKIKKLNEFQKKKIKKRLAFDFNEELNKIDDNKINFSIKFVNQIQNLIERFDDQGILFYGLKIKLPHSLEDENFWNNTHTDVEEFINYIGYSVELVELCYFSIEIEGITPIWSKEKKIYNKKKNIPYLFGIIAIRSILNKNKNIYFELKNLFVFSFFETEVSFLEKRSDIIKYWNFITKQLNFKFHSFVNYSNFYHVIYGEIADAELKFENYSAFGQENLFISPTMDISGIKKKNPIKEDIILYFIKLFMQKNNIKIYKNRIYSKIENSRVSWRFLYNILDIKSFFFYIFNEVKIAYPQQLDNFNFEDLLLANFDLVFSKIYKEPNLLVEFKLDNFDKVIEFSNGLFCINTKQFFEFSNFDFEGYKTNYYINVDYFDNEFINVILTTLSEKIEENKLEDFFTNLKIK